MDWNHPERVFGSSLDPVVLRVLWRTTGSMTGRQVQRVAEIGSVQGIRLALQRLYLQGIVDARQVGSSFSYSLNRNHFLFPAVDAAFRAIQPWQDLKDAVRSVVDAHFPHNGDETDRQTSVAAFGSVARGEARLDSDLDLLAIAPDSFADPAQGMADALRDLESRIGQRVQVYLTDPARLQQAVDVADPIVDSFKADALTLVGPDIRTYLESRT